MILIDTTVWIDFFAGKPCSHVEKLQNLIQQRMSLCCCGVILTEVLQGISNEKSYSRTKENLSVFRYLSMSQSTFIDAANIYRVLRKSGITIRKPIDCMIASVCMEHGVKLLHNDKDFSNIAKIFPLKFLS